MEFTPLQYAEYGQQNFLLAGLFGIIASVIALVLIFVIAAAMKMDAKKADSLIWISVVAGIVVGVISGFVLVDKEAKAIEHNKKAGAENIMEKYDIKAVLWSSPQTNAIPNLEPKWKTGREVVVEAKNGVKYIFLYELNKETSEPTLVDMAVPGGSNDLPAVNADSLLKR